MGVESRLLSSRVSRLSSTLEATMQAPSPRPQQAAIRTDLGAIFVSLELSRSAWLVTSVSPGGSEKMSKHQVCGGDVAGLLTRFAELQAKARARTGQLFPLIVVQEAGLDGFWLHRVLQSEGIEARALRAMSSTRHRSRPRAGGDGPRPTGLTARLWCGLFWLTSAASLGCVRW